MPIRLLEDRIQSGTTPSLGYEDRYPEVDMPASVLEAQRANQNIAGGNILDDLTYNQKVLGIGGATVGGLGATAAYQSMQDIKAINQMAKMGNYGTRNPMPQAFMDKLKGAYTPSSVFKKTGYPTGLKNWFFSRSSPGHFGPVEKTMKFAKNLPGYAMKGLGYLSSLPASTALMALHPTPANADEIEWQNRMMQNQRFKQQQLMNRRKQQMQETIRQAEAAEAAKKKVITTTPKGPPSITQKKKVTTAKGPPSIISKPKVTGPTYGPHTKPKKKYTPPQQTGGSTGLHGGGSKKGSPPTGTKGKNPWGRADGGLIRLFKYGGYLG